MTIPDNEATQAPAASPARAAKAAKKPCGVCTDFKSLRRKQAKQYNKAAASVTTAATTGGTSKEAQEDAYTPFPCPPDSGALGRSTWTFLHTMAAYYPEKPTPAEQLSMRNFVSALSRFYPCGYCADHLTKEIVRRPPDVTSNRTLSRWFCEVHNEVNERQGKPKFNCDRVFERWRDGSSGSDCFPDLGDE